MHRGREDEGAHVWKLRTEHHEAFPPVWRARLIDLRLDTLPSRGPQCHLLHARTMVTPTHHVPTHHVCAYVSYNWSPLRRWVAGTSAVGVASTCAVPVRQAVTRCRLLCVATAPLMLGSAATAPGLGAIASCGLIPQQVAVSPELGA